MLAQIMSRMNAARTHRTGRMCASRAPASAPRTAVGARNEASRKLSCTVRPRLRPAASVSDESVRFLPIAPTIDVLTMAALVTAIACRRGR